MPGGAAVSVFVFESEGKKAIYAPCDCKPFPENDMFNKADVLIMGNTIIGDVFKKGFVLAADNPLRKELFSLEAAIDIKKQYSIKELIITHIEEDFGKSLDDYFEIEKLMKMLNSHMTE